jgi:exodeoxyribonuclease-5
MSAACPPAPPSDLADIDLSEDQRKAIDQAMDWRNRFPDAKPAFCIAGLAGTGKTTLAAVLSGQWRNTAVATPSGKAADQLRSHGVAQARTLHHLLYTVRADRSGGVKFRRRPALLVGGQGDPAETVIVDEASMVDQQVARDLLAFGVPVLFVGDHGQLEPVGRDACLMQNPDVRLEQIHRQARNNPIIHLAHAFREGRPVPDWSDRGGRLRVCRRAEFPKHLGAGRQVIVGFNNTRHEINRRVRALAGRKGDLPVPGDRIVCLQNNRLFGLFNGQTATIVRASAPTAGAVCAEIVTDGGDAMTVPMRRDQFGRNLLNDHRDRSVCLFDFGYALTAHKAQGSEWDQVIVLEEISRSCDARRWRYTAVTRAREHLVYCR